MKMEAVLEPRWKLKEIISTVRDESMGRLLCFPWHPTKGNISPVRMTVQEHDEVGLPFSSSRPLWACLGSSESFVKLGHDRTCAEQMRMSVTSPGAHGTVPVFRTKPRGLLGHL